MADVEMPVSNGWIFCEYSSLVSKAGWPDASQDARAFAWRRSDSACLARASGLRAAIRPVRAAFTRRSLAVLTAQLLQWFRPPLMVVPQPRQRFSIRGATGAIRADTMPFASRLWL